MPATKILTKEQVEGNVKDVFNRAENHFGRIPNLVKVLATNPSMCTSITDFLIQSLGPGRVDWGFKELIILKTLRVMGSFYSGSITTLPNKLN